MSGTGGEGGERLRPLRRRAFSIAYRMLGSVGEAEDVAQESMLRLHVARRSGQRIDSEPAWIAVTATRLAIDGLRSARARRETYTGEWLPEPLPTAGPQPGGAVEEADPAEIVGTAETVSAAFLTLLESLPPTQRAALVLRDAFDYPYEQIAAIVGTSAANARQLVARARAELRRRRPRFEVDLGHHRELLESFLAATRDGDLAQLERLLAEDVELHGDGGGKVPALARPLQGRSRVARTLAAWSRNAKRAEGASFEPAVLNHGPGVLFRDAEGRILGAIGLDVHEGEIVALRSVVNPDKLAHLGPVGDMRVVVSGRGAAGGDRP
jgi:RNA polymerase sigma factor (sigma-70 family)